MSTPAPIDSSIATWDADEPQLLGGQCSACGTVTFPRLDGCPKCGSDAIDESPLSRRGTLWTWTTQGFLPKHPYGGTESEETFTPFLLGYIQLPEGVMVESKLVDADMDDIVIGQAMELTVVEAPTRSGGSVRTFAFRPVDQEAA